MNNFKRVISLIEDSIIVIVRRYLLPQKSIKKEQKTLYPTNSV